MGHPFGVLAETLGEDVQVTDETYTKRSPHSMWSYCEDIVFQLEVSDPGVAAGDSLLVTIYTVLPGGVRTSLIAFTAVPGDETDVNILNQIINVHKATAMSWSDRIEIEAVPTGATADFTFSVRAFGS